MDKQQAMVQAGHILAQVMQVLPQKIQVGVSTEELDLEATRLIKKFGGEISFNKVPGYRHATCMSVNEVVVHGIPNQYRLHKKDLLKIDIGVFYHGYHVDYCDTFLVGDSERNELKKFLDIGRKTLKQILNMSKKGTYLGKISARIEKNIEGANFKVLEQLTGHAVGRSLHEEPYIPGVLDCPIARTPKMQVGTAYALEVIYSFSDSQLRQANHDGWSLATKKNSLSACFENTVLITEKGGIVLIK